jgi:hypothetical protein
MDTIINHMFQWIQGYSLLAQTAVLVGLVTGWNVCANLQSDATLRREPHAGVGVLSFAFGAAAFIVMILMILSIIMTQMYRELLYIGVVVVYVIVLDFIVHHLLRE